MVYIGDGNNIVHSWLRLARVMPLHFVCCCPEDYTPDQETLDMAVAGGVSTITISHDPEEAVKDADYIYTDVWVRALSHFLSPSHRSTVEVACDDEGVDGP